VAINTLSEAMKRVELRETQAANLLGQRDAAIARLEAELAAHQHEHFMLAGERFEALTTTMAELTQRLQDSTLIKTTGKLETS